MKAALRYIREHLTPLYGAGETQAISRIIFKYLKGWSAVDMFMNEDKTLSDYMRGEIEKIVARLEKHEPIQYITGIAPFAGMDLKVRPGVLIPRPETEGLVDMIIDENAERNDLQVIDFCSGSGCIAIALSRGLKFADVCGVELSEKALEVARENAADLHARVHFIHADIFSYAPAPRSLDIVVSNPPYIEPDERAQMEPRVLDYEPPEALFVSADDPIAFYRRIAAVAAEALRPGGKLYFEINPRHSELLRRCVAAEGFSDIDIRRDIHGRERYLTAKLPEK